jgi:CO/xanthine dehydrogenase Mo-binding subunit
VAFDLQQWTCSTSTAEIGNFAAWRLVGGNPGWGRLSGGNRPHSYEFENHRMDAHYVEELLRAIYLRSPGRIQINFAVESFLDEIAAELKSDPVEIRIRYLRNNPTALRVMKAAAKKAGWQAGASPRKFDSKLPIVAGRGVAFGQHNESLVAMVAQVEVNRDTGKVHVLKVVASTFCGQITNPLGLRDQIHGATLHAIGRTLKEEVIFDRTNVSTLHWKTYPFLGFSEVPEIETDPLDFREVGPFGAGELGTVTVAAVLSNAIFDATGVRLREVPFTPDRVKAALSQAARHAQLRQ